MIMKNTFSVMLLVFLFTASFCSAPKIVWSEDNRLLFDPNNRSRQIFNERSLRALKALANGEGAVNPDKFLAQLKLYDQRGGATEVEEEMLRKEGGSFRGIKSKEYVRNHLISQNFPEGFAGPVGRTNPRLSAAAPAPAPMTPPPEPRQVKTLASSPRTGRRDSTVDERPKWSTSTRPGQPLVISLHQPQPERYQGEAATLASTPTRRGDIAYDRKQELAATLDGTRFFDSMSSSPSSSRSLTPRSAPYSSTPAPRATDLARQQAQLETTRVDLARAAEAVAKDSDTLNQQTADLRRQQNALAEQRRAASELAVEARRQLEAAGRAQQEVTTERERLRSEGQTQSEQLNKFIRASEELKRRAQDAQTAQQDAAQRSLALETALTKQDADLIATRARLTEQEHALRRQEESSRQMAQQLADAKATALEAERSRLALLKKTEDEIATERAARGRAEQERARLEQTLAQQQQTATASLLDAQRRTEELERDLAAALQSGEGLDGLQKQLRAAREAQAAQQARVAELEREVTAKRELEVQLRAAQRRAADLEAAAAEALRRGEGLTTDQQDELRKARAATANAERQITDLRQAAEAADLRHRQEISQAETRAQDAARDAAAETERERRRATDAERQLQESLTAAEELRARIRDFEATQAAAARQPAASGVSREDFEGATEQIRALQQELQEHSSEMRRLLEQETSRRAASRRASASPDGSDGNNSGDELSDSDGSTTGQTGRRGRRSAVGRRPASSAPAASATGGEGAVWAAAAKFLKTQTTFLGEQMTGERTSRDTAVTTAAEVEKTRIENERKRANRAQNTEEVRMSQQRKTRAAELQLEATRIKSASEVELARITADQARKTAKSSEKIALQERLARAEAAQQAQREAFLTEQSAIANRRAAESAEQLLVAQRMALAQTEAVITAAAASNAAFFNSFEKVLKAVQPQQPAAAEPAAAAPVAASAVVAHPASSPVSRPTVALSVNTQSVSLDSPSPSRSRRTSASSNSSEASGSSTPGPALTRPRPIPSPIRRFNPPQQMRRQKTPFSHAQSAALLASTQNESLKIRLRLAKEKTKQAEAEARKAAAQAATARATSSSPVPPPSPSSGSQPTSSFSAMLHAARGGSPDKSAASRTNPFFSKLHGARAQLHK